MNLKFLLTNLGKFQHKITSLNSFYINPIICILYLIYFTLDHKISLSDSLKPPILFNMTRNKDTKMYRLFLIF